MVLCSPGPNDEETLLRVAPLENIPPRRRGGMARALRAYLGLVK